MKVNVKKVLFILVCVELMIWYWATLDTLDQPGQVVYQQTYDEQEAPPHSKEGAVVFKKAS
ncbi:hypothetical protein ACFQ88_10135 [Paenibacillus sp. NPDC056579]|uniref:hypothetical protein n=1 Tax=unclassified Paenibacillus TaxID=185978 RepID=UPI001EF88F74|nr:hypothetical protein [Paenibacillus sp. H1-7]ULL14613.1 hypothetical protein DVH26_09205 [Paenibacillus sp. H1-7]